MAHARQQARGRHLVLAVLLCVFPVAVRASTRDAPSGGSAATAHGGAVGAATGSCYTEYVRAQPVAPRPAPVESPHAVAADPAAADVDAAHGPLAGPWFAEVARGSGIAPPRGVMRVAPNCRFSAATAAEAYEAVLGVDEHPEEPVAPVNISMALMETWSDELRRFAIHHKRRSKTHGIEESTHVEATGQFRNDQGGSCFNERGMPTGVAIGDFDGDGLPDVFLGMEYSAARLYRNNGDGTFEDVAARTGLLGRRAAAAQANSSRTYGADAIDSAAATGTAAHGTPATDARSSDRHLASVHMHADGTVGAEHLAGGTAHYDRGHSDESGNFVARTEDLLRSGSSAGAFIDVDNDGDLDLFVATMGKHRHYLFINTDGRGTFVEEAGPRGAGVTVPGDWALTSAAGIGVGDYDGDGWLDLYVCEWRMYEQRDLQHWEPGHLSNSRLLRNRGAEGAAFAGHFEDATDAAGVNIEALHVLFARTRSRAAFHGAGHFSTQDVQRSLGTASGTYSLSPVLQDFDDDGIVDLYLVSDFGLSSFYWGNGDGTFTESTADSGTCDEKNGMGATVGDVDGDGLLDIYVTAIGQSPSYDTRKILLAAHSPFRANGHVLYLNNGNRTFRQAWVVGEAKSWNWGAAFIDFDNDGDLDIYQASGFDLPETTADDVWNVTPNHLLVSPGPGAGIEPPAKNSTSDSDGDDDAPVDDQDWRYSDRLEWPDEAGAHGVADLDQGRAVATFDYDFDGDLDIIVSPGLGVPRLLRNDGGAPPAGSGGGGASPSGEPRDHAWLRVDVKERLGGRDSIHARVFLIPETPLADGSPQPAQSSVIGSKSFFMSQGEATAHFGLGPRTALRPDATYTVRVTWSAAGRRLERVITGVLPNHRLTVYKDANVDVGGRGGGGGGDDSGAASGISSDAQCPGSPVTLPPRATVPVGPPLDGVARPLDATASSPRVLRQPSALPGWAANIMKRVGSDLASLEAFAALPIHSASGHGNNEAHPSWGAAGTPLAREAPAAYGDGVEAMRGSREGPHGVQLRLPSPRLVSNVVFGRPDNASATRTGNFGLSEAAMHFGQLLAHDTDHTTPIVSSQDESFEPISVPTGDPTFDPEGTGGAVIRFRRSIYDHSTGTGPDNPRQQINKVTSFVDASCVYGSEARRMDDLRSHKHGQLAMQVEENAPAFNARGAPNDNPLARGIGDLVLAGDSRANIQPGLLALHTLFVREHNAFARHIWAALEQTYPEGAVPRGAAQRADDAVFAAARRLVIAEFQAITYSGYLRALLPPGAIPRYRGYKPEVNPAATNEFASAAFRFGHSQASDDMLLRYYNEIPRPRATDAVLPLKNAYFFTRELLSSREGGIDPVLRGMIERPAQPTDAKAVDAVRNFLFGAVGEGGVDLIATNIQRGRDHGVADYNSVRVALQLPRRRTFTSVTSDRELARVLAQLYPGGIDTLDLLVGGLAEDAVRGSAMGETFSMMLTKQFRAMRDGDRFWYENTAQGQGLGLTRAEAAAVTANATLASMLVRHVHFAAPVGAAIRTEQRMRALYLGTEPAPPEWSDRGLDRFWGDVFLHVPYNLVPRLKTAPLPQEESPREE